MNKDMKNLVTIISASLIVVLSLTLGLKMIKEEGSSLTNKNSANNHVVEIKNTCDKDSSFPDAIEEYYKDDKYICSFNQIKSGCYVVEVDGKKYSLKDALNHKVITVEEAIDQGMFCKEITGSNNNQPTNTNSNPNSNQETNFNENNISNPNENTNTNSNEVSNSNNTNSDITSNTNSNKNSNSNVLVQNKISIVDKCGKYVTQQIDEFYEDSKYVYYFTSGRSGCTYVNVNGKEYTLKNALNNKVVTMEQLETAGFQCLKKSKNFVNK